jgi:hypothetical protein
MFKKLALVTASTVLALSCLASGAHAEHWHGGYAPRPAYRPCYNCGPNWGAVAVGTMIGVAAADAINGQPAPGYYPPQQGMVYACRPVLMANGYWVRRCGYEAVPPHGIVYGFTGNAPSGNGYPISN